MAQNDVIFFDVALEWTGSDVLDLQAGTWKVALITEAPPAANTANPILGTFTEVTAGGNYTAGGELVVVTWGQSAGTAIFDAVSVASWASDPGNPTNPQTGVLYKEGTFATIVNPCLCNIDLGGVFDMTTGPLTVSWPTFVFDKTVV